MRSSPLSSGTTTLIRGRASASSGVVSTTSRDVLRPTQQIGGPPEHVSEVTEDPAAPLDVTLSWIIRLLPCRCPALPAGSSGC